MVKAKLRYLRISPRKVRLIADLVRGKSVEKAVQILNFIIKRGSKDVLKLLKSAVASAGHDFQLEESNLYISKITVDDGPKLKRFRPRARGSASEIQKKTAHITIILDEIKPSSIKTPVVKKTIEGKEEIKPVSTKITADKTEKPKFELTKEAPKIKAEKGLKKIFKRKTF